MKEKILLIDGHSIINRAFYGLPDLTSSEGIHTGAVYGFLNILLRMIDDEKPDYLAVAFDVHAPTFRHKMYTEYKGTRHPMPQELVEQVPLLQEMLTAMEVRIVTLPGFEADDIIGTLARRSEAAGMDTVILSGDRDLLQLVTENVRLRLPRTAKGQTTMEDFGPQEVLEKYQVTPEQIVDLKALMGDSSDNIPGLPGVGEKTATKLIVEYKTIENAYEHAAEIKPNKAKDAFLNHFDLAELSKKLAKIETDAPLEMSYESARAGKLFTGAAYELCKKLEFKNLLGRFDEADMQEHADILEHYVCTDREGIEALFEKAAGFSHVGLSVIEEDGAVLACAVSLPGQGSYVMVPEGEITVPFIMEQIAQLSKNISNSSVDGNSSQNCTICSMDVKALLKHVDLDTDANVFDVSVAAYLMNPLKSTYSYDDIAREFAGGLMLPAKEDLLGKTGFSASLMIQPDKLYQYAVSMAYASCVAYEPLTQALRDSKMWEVYSEIELPLIFTLDSMEKEGVRVDGEQLKTYGQDLEVRIHELENKIWEQAGEKFNINSPKQMGQILFEKMGIPGGKKTKTGFSTSADILEKLAPEQPIIRDILDYRQVAKLKSTYADGLLSVIREDGRIHSTFNQTITATGRISSTEPNLQNIPVRMELGRLIRKAFVPDPGCVFLDADYSQIELRVLAHMSGDEKLIQAYREAQDIHRLTASQVFHVPFDEVTPLMRRNAKAVNFGIVYGISSFGLSQDLSISRKEAADYIEKYFQTYPKIKAFLDGLVKDAKEKGYAVTLFGRRRPVPELSSGNFMTRQFGERVAMNSPIQGTAADIIKIAMNRVYRRLREENLSSRLVLQVHDELLIETREEEAEQVSRILEEEMTGACSLSVALEVDMHTGSNWYEAK